MHHCPLQNCAAVSWFFPPQFWSLNTGIGQMRAMIELSTLHSSTVSNPVLASHYPLCGIAHVPIFFTPNQVTDQPSNLRPSPTAGGAITRAFHGFWLPDISSPHWWLSCRSSFTISIGDFKQRPWGCFSFKHWVSFTLLSIIPRFVGSDTYLQPMPSGLQIYINGEHFNILV